MKTSWTELISEWGLIEFDFQALLHQDLEELLPVKTWRWFTTRVGGLLSRPDSLLHAHFAPEPEAPPAPTD